MELDTRQEAMKGEGAMGLGVRADAAGLAVVGVGASAGGLEAFQELVASISPEHQRRAWVLVQHLDPDHQSLLPELLARRTKLPVVTITDGMPLSAGVVHLIPPGSELSVCDNRLRLRSFDTPRGLRRPIDVFFKSLADAFGAHCAAIVLSGTGSDGSVGIRAVKEAGGLVFVQDPKQAKYDGMPKSALATNAADLVLPVADMVSVIDEYFDRRSGIEPTIENDAQFIERVAKHIRYRTGHDFTHYKRPTLLRRLARRMSVLGLQTPTAYLQRLISDANEASFLFRDLLINVTSFFRDASAFEALRRIVIPEIVRDKGRGDDIRIWVPGCSSGQEAYSIAMLVEEELQRTDARPQVSIFATDIDADSLRIAREGLYPNSIAAEVPEDLLERYFSSTPQGYKISAGMRDMVRVSHHNVTKDPPFSRIDLVSCRNLLIYFDTQLQTRTLSVFHYALAAGGYLLLGPSENLGAAGDHFETVDQGEKLFRRKEGPARLNLPLAGAPHDESPEVPQLHSQNPAVTPPDVYERAVLARHAPTFVVVNPQREIVYTSGRTGRFLELSPGRAQLGLLDMCKPELKAPLRGLLSSVGGEPGLLTQRPYSGRIDDADVNLVLAVERLRDDNILVVFQDRLDTHFSASANDGAAVALFPDAYVSELEQKLDAAHQTIRTTVEELETSNEELKSSNEEMMSMNEELQSANEELSTINEELQTKVTELNALNDDQRNLIESTGIATIFLDSDLRIRSFTPAATRYFRLLKHDRGRAFGDIVSDLEGESIAELCKHTLATGIANEVARSSRNGAHDLLVRTQPYLKASGPPGGVVVTLTEVTEITGYARRLQEAQDLAQQNLTEVEELYRVTPQAKALLDKNLCFLRVNQRFAAISGLAIERHLGRSLADVVPDLAARILEPARRVTEEGKSIFAGEVTALVDGVQQVWEVDLYPVPRAQGGYAVGLNLREVTKFKVMEAEQLRLMMELQHRVKNMLSNVTALINRARRDAGDPRVVLESLVSRIQALAKTHNLLTAQNWRPSRLIDVLTQELVAVYGEDRIAMKGPDVRINARATLAIGMAVHELGTNAAKYGALSTGRGRLSVSWARTDRGDGEMLVLDWNEMNGPQVIEPERVGFGSQLVAMTIEKSLGGRVEPRFDPAGFKVRFVIPYKRVTEDAVNVAEELSDLQGPVR